MLSAIYRNNPKFLKNLKFLNFDLDLFFFPNLETSYPKSAFPFFTLRFPSRRCLFSSAFSPLSSSSSSRHQHHTALILLRLRPRQRHPRIAPKLATSPCHLAAGLPVPDVEHARPHTLSSTRRARLRSVTSVTASPGL